MASTIQDICSDMGYGKVDVIVAPKMGTMNDRNALLRKTRDKAVVVITQDADEARFLVKKGWGMRGTTEGFYCHKGA